jgi:hypothetical protein
MRCSASRLPEVRAGLAPRPQVLPIPAENSNSNMSSPVASCKHCSKTGSELALSSPAMSRVGADDDGAGASKKLRVVESENENEHVVSMIQMVRGA